MENSKDYENWPKIGDTVWFANGGEQLASGVLVKIVDDIEGWDKIYLIRVSTHIDAYIEAREWHTISDNPKGPLNFWRRSDNNLS